MMQMLSLASGCQQGTWMISYRLGKELEDVDKEGGQASAAHPIWKTFWRLPIPHKILIFRWKVAKDGVATEVNKRTRRCWVFAPYVAERRNRQCTH